MIDISALDVKYLAGVGPQRSLLLAKELAVRTVADLLYYFPYRHIDRSRIYAISELTSDMPYVQVRGRIVRFEEAGEGRNRRMVAHFTDDTGFVDLVWFQGVKHLLNRYKVGEEYLVFGKPTVFNGRVNIAHPDIDRIADVKLQALGMQPLYNTSERMKRSTLNSHSIEKMMASAVRLLKDDIPETLPQHIVTGQCLMPLAEALRNIHFPRSVADLNRARTRLKFEELFYLQLNILRYASDRRKKYRGYVFARVGENFHAFYNKCMPFELTGAQKRVLREMRADMGSGRQMNRLLQGDVGSGKTMVALLCMLLALDNGFQACLMAPTEILASQHYET